VMLERTKVLLIEDNMGDARLLELMLEEANTSSYDVAHATRLGDALALLQDGRPDVMLLDLGLPDAQGLDTVRRARAVAGEVPLIVLTGVDDEAMAVQALQEGAQDYLAKGRIASESLTRAIRYAMQRHRMQTEADLARQRQLHLKDEFLSHVSHELRSPLTAIHQFVTILRDGLAGDLNIEQQQYLDIAVKNVDQLSVMIDDLLEVTRAESGKLFVEPQFMDAEAAILDVFDTLQKAADIKGVELTAKLPPILPPISADPARVRQILINLVGNAIKFTPAGGHVSVNATVPETDPETLCIEVTDDGCGIDPASQGRVFERLYQAGESSDAGRRGLGLGLYICKQLVDRHGGRIWVTSKPGEGSTFSFTLPVFALTKLLGPILVRPERASQKLALILVTLERPMGRMSDAVWSEISNETRHLVHRCLLPDLDVLLPRMASSSSREEYMIVARADAHGIEVLEHRLHQQLNRSGPLASTAARWNVRWQFLELEGGDGVLASDVVSKAIDAAAHQLQTLPPTLQPIRSGVLQ
jgi:signal transduction histidine kinase